MGLDELEAAINRVRQSLKAEAEQREKLARYFEYEISRMLPIPVRVAFEPPDTNKYTPVVYGDVLQEAGEFRIRVKPDLPLAFIPSVLSHELGHIVKGHVPSSTPELRQRGKINQEIWADGILNDVAGGIDTSEIYWQLYWKQENEADEQGKINMGALFPGEEYQRPRDGIPKAMKAEPEEDKQPQPPATTGRMRIVNSSTAEIFSVDGSYLSDEDRRQIRERIRKYREARRAENE